MAVARLPAHGVRGRAWIDSISGGGAGERDRRSLGTTVLTGYKATAQPTATGQPTELSESYPGS